ncbi:hypothetical protein FQA39_LY07510 [Lamprigera yunnana]|nr:hypothetical protein FQA39_LY07510 [Lamprigera yunnana]
MEKDTDFESIQPRDYQITIMESALKSNSIIYLPTGSGKTLIAIMILKQLSKPLLKSFSAGGKLSIVIVNTITLVHQQAKYVRNFVDFNIGAYCGDMNVDSWNRDMWINEFETHQILVMTAQILVNILGCSFLSLNDINLLIFDECHNGVNDHAMRQVMRHFKDLEEAPRVIGLSATLLNKSCRPQDVIEEISVLETTFHGKVLTVENLYTVSGYSTNPKETICEYKSFQLTSLDEYVVSSLEEIIKDLSGMHFNENCNSFSPQKQSETEKKFKREISVAQDVIYHIKLLGAYGGLLALLAHMIQLERIKKNCQDLKSAIMYNAMIGRFLILKKMIVDHMSKYSEVERIYKYCSNQVITLLEILKEYPKKVSQPLCGIVFVQRRFTAKILYNILKHLKQFNSTYSFITPNYIVGFNNNPYNDTREGLYKTKMNRKVLNQFYNKEVNLLVASNVLEEGVDIPLCTLVVSFDKLHNYRAYVQSKGRARHKDSHYYMLVNESDEFHKKYSIFKEVEDVLCSYLIGTNEIRTGPTDQGIQNLYDELDILPYFVNGPCSPQVNLLTAIPLLCRYCLALPSDKYTVYNPTWKQEKSSTGIRFIIELPTVTNVFEPIEGPFMSTKKQAKRAAALYACKILHEKGELDDELQPKPVQIVKEDFSQYFAHWPEQNEKFAGYNKSRRLHSKQIPLVCNGSIQPNTNVYLHIIELHPQFINDNPSTSMLSELFQSETSFGVLSVQPLPRICKFSVYVTAGEIKVNFMVNYKCITLNVEQLEHLIGFQYLIFKDVLKVLRPFLTFIKENNLDGLLVVPIKKNLDVYDIDFEVAENNKTLIEQRQEPTITEKKALDITEENYLGKIVTPWYRSDEQIYVVTKVCIDLNASSMFPSEEFESYESYFKEKYDKDIINRDQPLLLVKSISKRLNCLRPRCSTNKRTRDKIYEDVEEHLIPELCVKQDLPGALWIQSTLLPTILYRITSLLQADQLRKSIALESGLGLPVLPQNEEWAPLVLDVHVMNFTVDGEPKIEKSEQLGTELMKLDFKLPITEMRHLMQDFSFKKLDNEYPWDIEEEPIDIDRNLDVTLMEIHYYETFMSQKVSSDGRIQRNHPHRSNLPAITFNRSYIYREIKLLKPLETTRGPDLKDIFTALTTAKNNDIVNLERMETLGDSFLKLSTSLFLILRYPTFDEGRLTKFKGQLVSNKNLYYIGKKNSIPGYIKVSVFSPEVEWKPPSFGVPKILLTKLNNKELSLGSLFCFLFSREECISGDVSDDSLQITVDTQNDFNCPNGDDNDVGFDSMHSFIDVQLVSDKTVADCVEALLGVYFMHYGFQGCLRLLKWFEIIPASENIDNLLNMAVPNPILNKNATISDIIYHLPAFEKVESKLNYTFKNRGYLLQALTHSSYTANRITNCYQRLEFLGDAILDFLITSYIFESCENLTPGELTDLRSALVNNMTFASFTVRCGFHKYILFSNNQLLHYIQNFVDYQESKNYEIDEHVLILLEADDLHLADHVDVPKVLGDTFEALAGAIFLDSGMSLEAVWKVFYSIMWKEIEAFKSNVPKNAVRLIYETGGAHPEFEAAVTVDGERTMVGLNFMLNGMKKKVYGFGENKGLAKKAAAKIALRLLQKY